MSRNIDFLNEKYLSFRSKHDIPIVSISIFLNKLYFYKQDIYWLAMKSFLPFLLPFILQKNRI